MEKYSSDHIISNIMLNATRIFNANAINIEDNDDADKLLDGYVNAFGSVISKDISNSENKEELLVDLQQEMLEAHYIYQALQHYYNETCRQIDLDDKERKPMYSVMPEAFKQIHL